jgi:ubiquinone/menaquinone biosynthesis C-methylase UbiE
MSPYLFGISVITCLVAILITVLGWRWASRVWPLPCPASFAWLLEADFYSRFTGTEITLRRMPLAQGQRVLEIGPGPGRLLIPAAERIQPGGEAVGIDIQPGMIDRLMTRAQRAGLTNVSAIVGDATKPIVPANSFDVAFLATTLGEIPDRAAALTQCFRALKPGGILSITEMLPDPHYQSQATVTRLAESAGFILSSIEGNWWLFTANFSKP